VRHIGQRQTCAGILSHQAAKHGAWIAWPHEGILSIGVDDCAQKKHSSGVGVVVGEWVWAL